MKLVKNIVLSLMLITFFSLVIMSVSAADVMVQIHTFMRIL